MKNEKPKVLEDVERITHKSYGERPNGKTHILVHKNDETGSAILPPIFANVAICMACGKEEHVNTCGFCEECWVQFSHLRGRNAGGAP